ncbi:hypothetical protein PHYSODRAFT_254622 [Phytophthora sojae]|uniref:Uncharacterized protein n=1 Tax=Phytophthora sojae (strain P6497) TaxID=1094619 RepID=G5A3P5_PHYSP|nr:hypothetical protein PHYSODRAFT_254622 [Phytophthora sojae]EGZ09418.1 hypothetical protein PHYSODRAFT_254622 [Phytophthora sojae]|eukprot:XP_009534279.1 hypothetical protein PHYSODRAFT_254622 [Phytophthora sojae]
MVFVSRPPRPTFTLAQTRRNGFTNLMQHVRREHPNFEAEMLEATTAETGSLLSYVRRSSQNLYGWLVWVVMSNLPFAFCENRTTRRYTNLDPVCIETLRAVLEGVSLVVERSIAAEIPPQFGLILDGWTHLGEHYLAVFARFEVNGQVMTPLLCMAPLLQEEDDDLSAVAHREFLANMLPRDFGKQLDQCVYIVGGNCRANRRLATSKELEDHEADLSDVQNLMTKLRTLTQSVKLRLKTKLRPVIRQDTRWSSTFTMLHRYFELLEHLDAHDDDIADLLPAPASNRRLRALLKELTDVESVSKALQGEDADLLDVREWFDGLIAVKLDYANYLGPRADIVHSPDFESGCVRVLLGNTNRLIRAEKAVLRPFAANMTPDPSTDDDSQGSFVERLQKRRRLAQHQQ